VIVGDVVFAVCGVGIRDCGVAWGILRGVWFVLFLWIIVLREKWWRNFERVRMIRRY
jgi:hypothetical protein